MGFSQVLVFWWINPCYYLPYLCSRFRAGVGFLLRRSIFARTEHKWKLYFFQPVKARCLDLVFRLFRHSFFTCKGNQACFWHQTFTAELPKRWWTWQVGLGLMYSLGQQWEVLWRLTSGWVPSRHADVFLYFPFLLSHKCRTCSTPSYLRLSTYRYCAYGFILLASKTSMLARFWNVTKLDRCKISPNNSFRRAWQLRLSCRAKHVCQLRS